jgi:hypothetical protein
MQSVPIIANIVSSNPAQTRCSQYIKSMYFKFLYRISVHFLMKLDLNVLHNKIIYFYHAFSSFFRF